MNTPEYWFGKLGASEEYTAMWEDHVLKLFKDIQQDAITECAKLCDWKIVCLGGDINPAAKRAIEEVKIHILNL